MEAINWRDVPQRTPGNVVLTEPELRIPGLRTFGWMNLKNAAPALKPHFHENAFELAFVIKGTINFCTETREYAVYGGDAFLTQPNEIHSTNETPLSVGQLAWLQLDISDPSRFLFLNREAAEALIQSLEKVRHHCIRTDNGSVVEAEKELVRYVIREEEPQNRYELAGKIVALLYQLLSFADVDGFRVSPDIAGACDDIDAHLAGEITLEELADRAGLSLSQFKHKFKKQIGLSPREYINQKKIARIREQLTEETNLTQLAFDYGFCTSSYFSVVFKKYTGCTPSEYIHQQEH